MNIMTYEGYCARVEYSQENACLVGNITGSKDIIGFHGESIAGLRGAFEKTFDDYLETCNSLNRQPSKPFSGNLELNIPPEIHAGIAVAAEISGKAIGQWVEDAFTNALSATP